MERMSDAKDKAFTADTVPPPPSGDAYSAETLVNQAPPDVLRAMRERPRVTNPDSETKLREDDVRESAPPVWRASPALVEAVKRDTESRRPPGQAPSSEPPLPRVGAPGLPKIPSIDEPDEDGVTRLRPGLGPPSPPVQQDTMLYVSAPRSVTTPPPPPLHVTRTSSRRLIVAIAAGVFLLTVVVLVLGFYAWKLLSPGE